MTTKQTIVVAWVENSGRRETGRLVSRDLNWFPEFESCPEAKACLWIKSGTAEDKANAEKFANQNGYTVYTFPTAERDPLGKAKRMALESNQLSAAS